MDHAREVQSVKEVFHESASTFFQQNTVQRLSSLNPHFHASVGSGARDTLAPMMKCAHEQRRRRGPDFGTQAQN